MILLMIIDLQKFQDTQIKMKVNMIFLKQDIHNISSLAKARDLKGDKENIITIIGDGSLSDGMAYAENDKENWHYGAPFNAQNGSRPVEEDYGDITALKK